jgi:hypothetical protein
MQNERNKPIASASARAGWTAPTSGLAASRSLRDRRQYLRSRCIIGQHKKTDHQRAQEVAEFALRARARAALPVAPGSRRASAPCPRKSRDAAQDAASRSTGRYASAHRPSVQGGQQKKGGVCWQIGKGPGRPTPTQAEAIRQSGCARVRGVAKCPGSLRTGPHCRSDRTTDSCRRPAR